jgi:hypothetical protein
VSVIRAHPRQAGLLGSAALGDGRSSAILRFDMDVFRGVSVVSP